MKSKTFLILLSVVVAVCVVLTLIHLIYAISAYKQCSIIYFIAKELW